MEGGAVGMFRRFSPGSLLSFFSSVLPSSCGTPRCVNFLVRKMAGMARPTAIIRVEDGTIHIETDAGFFTNVDDIKLNVEYDKVQQKVKHKAIATYEDGVFKIKLTPVGADIKPHTVTREIVGDELLMTMYIGDVVCKRYFKRLE